MSGLAAVLFDMDGTLVDTEVLWWEATEEVAARLGHRLSDADAPEVVGRAVEDTAAHLVRATGAPDTDGVATALTTAFQRRVDEGAPMRPGADRLLAELERAGLPFALVSASPRSVVDSVIGGALAHVPFALTLSADDTPGPNRTPTRTARPPSASGSRPRRAWPSRTRRTEPPRPTPRGAPSSSSPPSSRCHRARTASSRTAWRT